MRKKVPARTVIHCDKCKSECDRNGIRADGTHTYRTTGTIPFELDLCGICTELLKGWLDS